MADVLPMPSSSKCSNVDRKPGLPSSAPRPTRVVLGPLFDIPVELVENVLLFVDSTEDLLSLALTCKSMCQLVIPDYLQWHSVSIPADNAAAFETLNHIPRLAAFVHNLIITDSETTCSQGYYLMAHSPADGALPRRNHQRDWKAINGAAAHLVSLRSLVLHVKHIADYKAFVNTVQQVSPCFAEIYPQQFLGYYYFARVSSGPAIDFLSSLRNFTTFDWYSVMNNGPTIMQSITSTLTAQCPNLQHLKLNISSDDTASTDLWQCRWPALRSAQILNIYGSRDIGPFLAAHPLLEVFHVHATGGLHFDLPSDVLARARDVDIRYFGRPELFVSLVSPMSNGQRRPLEALGVCAQALVRPMSGGEWGSSLEVFCKNAKELPTLRLLRWVDLSFNLTESAFLGRIARACPGIETIVLAWNLPLVANGSHLDLISAALGEFSNLQTLQCPSSTLLPYEKLSQAEHLGRQCQSLRRINDLVNEDGEWNFAKGVRTDWRRVTY